MRMAVFKCRGRFRQQPGGLGESKSNYAEYLPAAKARKPAEFRHHRQPKIGTQYTLDFCIGRNPATKCTEPPEPTIQLARLGVQDSGRRAQARSIQQIGASAIWFIVRRDFAKPGDVDPQGS
jgi:hypothetical protein